MINALKTFGRCKSLRMLINKAFSKEEQRHDNKKFTQWCQHLIDNPADDGLDRPSSKGPSRFVKFIEVSGKRCRAEFNFINLRDLSTSQAKRLGFREWKDYGEHLLIPYWIWPFLRSDTEVRDIFTGNDYHKEGVPVQWVCRDSLTSNTFEFPEDLKGNLDKDIRALKYSIAQWKWTAETGKSKRDYFDHFNLDHVLSDCYICEATLSTRYERVGLSQKVARCTKACPIATEMSKVTTTSSGVPCCRSGSPFEKWFKVSRHPLVYDDPSNQDKRDVLSKEYAVEFVELLERSLVRLTK